MSLFDQPCCCLTVLTTHRNPIYKVMEVPCYREREFETGQLLINKRLHWRALNLAWCVATQIAYWSKPGRPIRRLPPHPLYFSQQQQQVPQQEAPFLL